MWCAVWGGNRLGPYPVSDLHVSTCGECVHVVVGGVGLQLSCFLSLLSSNICQLET